MNKWLIWCFYNDEQSALEKIFGDLCVSIKGSTSEDDREILERKWSSGSIPILITKPKCYGFGLNWQHCNNMIFVGTNNSYEQYYQSIRRCYRYGQKNDVNVYLVHSSLEYSVLKHIKRKEILNNEQKQEMENRTKEGFLNRIKNIDLRIVNNITIPNYLFTKGEDEWNI